MYEVSIGVLRFYLTNFPKSTQMELGDWMKRMLVYTKKLVTTATQ